MKKTALILVLVTALVVTALPVSASSVLLKFFPTLEAINERPAPIPVKETMQEVKDGAKKDVENGVVFYAKDPFAEEVIPEPVAPIVPEVEKEDVITQPVVEEPAVKYIPTGKDLLKFFR